MMKRMTVMGTRLGFMGLLLGALCLGLVGCEDNEPRSPYDHNTLYIQLTHRSAHDVAVYMSGGNEGWNNHYVGTVNRGNNLVVSCAGGDYTFSARSREGITWRGSRRVYGDEFLYLGN